MKARLQALWAQPRVRELVRYGLIGLATTAVNYLAFVLATRGAHLPYQAANALGWVLSVLFAFFANKLYVFESRSWRPALLAWEFFSFAAARVLSLGLEAGFLAVAIEWWGMLDLVAKLLANVIVIVANYFLSKLVIFRGKEG